MFRDRRLIIEESFAMFSACEEQMLRIQSDFPASKEVSTECTAALERVLNNKSLGFHQTPMRLDLWDSAERLGQKLRSDFSDMVIVGVGGSSIGVRVLAEVFVSEKKLHFLDNMDVIAYERLLQSFSDWSKVCWVFISKSGSTVETLVGADLILQELSQRKLSASHHTVVVSEPRQNPLTQWANLHGVSMLELPQDVGGRFSILTSVGLLPASFLGVPLEEMRRGALHALQSKDVIVGTCDQFLQSFHRQEWISFFWFYSSELRWFGDWLKQLWAESLAKKINRDGLPAPRVSTPYTAIGACDQHSLLQQLMEGERDKFILFVRIHSCENPSGLKIVHSAFEPPPIPHGKSMGELFAAQVIATRKALHHEKVSTAEMIWPDLSAETLAEKFMFWELVVATLGEVLNLNAFDQPGVELGKRIARQHLNS